MIRIVCPHCHASLATGELERATLGGCACLLCPECASVLVSEFHESGTHGLAEQGLCLPPQQMSSAGCPVFICERSGFK